MPPRSPQRCFLQKVLAAGVSFEKAAPEDAFEKGVFFSGGEHDGDSFQGCALHVNGSSGIGQTVLVVSGTEELNWRAPFPFLSGRETADENKGVACAEEVRKPAAHRPVGGRGLVSDVIEMGAGDVSGNMT